MIDKNKHYESDTEKLIKQVQSLRLPDGFYTKYNMVEIAYRIREAFKNPLLRKEVLNQKNENERIELGLYSLGFCGIAAYTWNHMFRMPEDGSEIWVLKKFENQKQVYGLTHHVWNENIMNFNNKLDFSFDSSVNINGDIIEIPYYLGEKASSSFIFQRAIKFSRFIGIDLEKIVIRNSLMNNYRE